MGPVVRGGAAPGGYKQSSIGKNQLWFLFGSSSSAGNARQSEGLWRGPQATWTRAGRGLLLSPWTWVWTPGKTMGRRRAGQPRWAGVDTSSEPELGPPTPLPTQSSCPVRMLQAALVIVTGTMSFQGDTQDVWRSQWRVTMALLPRCPVLFLRVQNVSSLRRLPCFFYWRPLAQAGQGACSPPCPGSLWEQLGDRASGAVVGNGGGR